MHRRHIPQPPLSGLVSCLWYWEGEPSNHRLERLLPNGEPSIIFNLREEPLRIYEAQDVSRFRSYGLAALSGARSDCFVIDADQQERVVGVQFHPGGAYPFFRMPMSEMEGESVDLADLWPHRAAEIRERLLAAPTVCALFQVLEQCLVAALMRPPELHSGVEFALRQFGRSMDGRSIAAVSAQVDLSSRRFIELFHRQVGLRPKVFQRVRRFQSVLQAVHGKREVEWTQIALECGYYDQAHFIHDFRAFSGLRPSDYLAAATMHLNHVPMG